MMNHPVILRGSKTVIAMAHVPALPGAPDYDSQMGMQKLHDWIARDVEALQTGGWMPSCSGTSSTDPMF